MRGQLSSLNGREGVRVNCRHLMEKGERESIPSPQYLKTLLFHKTILSISISISISLRHRNRMEHHHPQLQPPRSGGMPQGSHQRRDSPSTLPVVQELHWRHLALQQRQQIHCGQEGGAGEYGGNHVVSPCFCFFVFMFFYYCAFNCIVLDLLSLFYYVTPALPQDGKIEQISELVFKIK